jgi:hypothetical protein
MISMAGKTKKPNQKLQAWIDARKRHHLSDAQVRMARELGMNPAKLGKLDNHKQEPWKLPLPQFIEELYFKRRGKTGPDAVSVSRRPAGLLVTDMPPLAAPLSGIQTSADTDGRQENDGRDPGQDR